MVAGLIHDIPSCKELVERIVSDAEEIINNQLNSVKTT
jgi:nitronate monooxygenase